MNTYEKQMYDFYTEPEHFKTALEVSNYLETIRKQVIEEFWKEVVNKSEELCKIYLPDNIVHREEDTFEQYSQLGIYNPNFPKSGEEEVPFWATFQSLSGRLYLGIWINHESENWRINELRYTLEKLPGLKGAPSKNPWWISVKYMDYDFSDLKSIEDILPANRQTIINEFSKELLDLALLIENGVNLVNLLNENRV